MKHGEYAEGNEVVWYVDRENAERNGMGRGAGMYKALHGTVSKDNKDGTYAVDFEPAVKKDGSDADGEGGLNKDLLHV